MLDTAVPPDYCDNDVSINVQQVAAGVNSLEKKGSIPAKGRIDLYVQSIGYWPIRVDTSTVNSG